MSKIYELDISLFDKVKNNPTCDKFIFTNIHTRKVVVVDNTTNEFFTEDFSNRLKGLIYLTNNNFLPPDVEKEYLENQNKYDYEKYKKVVSDSCDYYVDRNLGDRDFLKFDPKKKYVFDINIGLGKKQFKATIKDALGLAVNYESDLGYNGILLISPLGFEWEENHKLIEKCVGRENLSRPGDMFGWFFPYRRPDSSLIEWLDKEKNIKI